MRKQKTNKFLLLITVILLLLIIGYFLVPFLNYGWLKKIYSPICNVIKTYQGEQYRPAWCLEPNQGKKIEQGSNININLNSNSNANTNLNLNQPVGLANPAAVKCIKDGGVSEPYQTPGGEAALCVFPDKSICEEWAYFRSECQVGKCFKKCAAIGSKSEGWYNSCTNELIVYANCAPAAGTAENLNQNITITSPIAGEQLVSPFKVAGQAIAYQNKIYIRVKNKSGATLISLDTLARQQTGMQMADFSMEIKYEFNTTKEGYVEVYSFDQNGQEVNLVSIPVKF